MDILLTIVLLVLNYPSQANPSSDIIEFQDVSAVMAPHVV
jgi:hypothetical protein